MKARLCFLFLLISLILSGCNGSSEESQDALNIMYYAYNSNPILSWDPSIEYSNGIITLNNIYEQLMRFNPNTKEYEYLLATKYIKSDDGLKWTFTLREGVKFHDGTPFNADAVKFSIERTVEKGQGASFIWDPVKEIHVVDDYTIEFELSYPAPVDVIVSCPYGAFIMSPSIKDKDGDWFSIGNECGTGPYKLQATTAGDEVILERFDDYWKGWNSKHFDKVIIKKISETSSRRQLIEEGEVDITMELPYEDIDALKENSNVVINEQPSMTNLLAFFNTSKPPLNNLKVRQALSYAFPYDQVVQYAMGGYAEQSHGPVPEGMWGHSSDLYQYKYDLDKAKSLLQEAGIREGELKLLLTYMSGDEAEKKTAELYKAELSKIGIELEIRSMPWESQWELAKGSDTASQQDIFIMYWWCDLATPYSYLYSLFHTEEETLYNVSHYSNKEFDNLIDDAQKETAVDIKKAEEKFIESQKLLVEDCPALFIYDKRVVWVESPLLKGHSDNSAYPFVVFFYDCYRE